jgi:hypothetical protein
MLRSAASDLDPLARQLAALAYRQVREELDRLDVAAQLQGDEKARYEALRAGLATHDASRPAELPTAFAATDIGPLSPPTHLAADPAKELVEPGYLSIFDPAPADIEGLAGSTGRRSALALWIASPDNPLTARVMVNRIWRYRLGRGLAASTSDFGRLGGPPSHPQLLDWLASRLMEEGWSVKRIDRLIVTSAAYRRAALGSQADEARRIDPENRFFARRDVRRLEAEQVRDAMLAVSGELDLSQGGPSVEADQPRRSIYVKVVRNKRDPLMESLDAPDGFSSVAERHATTTPTQSLVLVNGPWPLARAQALAARLAQEAGSEPATLIERAFALAYGRPPDSSEREAALRFLSAGGSDLAAAAGQPSTAAQSSPADGPAPASAPAAEALVDLCHVLLNSNAFLYVD